MSLIRFNYNKLLLRIIDNKNPNRSSFYNI